MNINKKGFTLIELLVVIVIIGILATISVATFGGYFKKARDAERKSVVQNVATIMKVINATNETIDYSSGTTITNNLPADLNTILAAQGYAVPTSKNGFEYLYAFDTSKTEFVVAACSEENFDASGTYEVFTAGTPVGVGTVLTCAANSKTPVVTDTADWDDTTDVEITW